MMGKWEFDGQKIKADKLRENCVQDEGEYIG
jgi:hypothetical protein